MDIKHSIVTRLLLIITLSGTGIFAATLGYNDYQSRQLLEQELESNARHLALSLVNRVETELTAVRKITEGLARSVELITPDEPVLMSLIRTTVEANPEIYGAGVAFEPYAFNSNIELYAPYFFRNHGKISLSPLEKSYQHLSYLHWDWYQIPRETGVQQWSEPYFDDGAGNILMSTCSVPFYQTIAGKKVMRGVVTADVSLDALTSLISSVKILDTGYAAVLSRNGMILAHPLQDAIMNDTFFSIAEARNDPAMRELGRRMVRGESGFVLYNSLVGVRSWMYFAPVSSTGWTLAVVFPEKELMANVSRLSLTMAIIGMAGILMLAVALYFIASSVIRPLRDLAGATHRMADGDFDTDLPTAARADEVGLLTEDFERMRQALKDYIRNLTETTAAKERIQSELKVATNIQSSLLPRVFPPFPAHPEFDLYASMVPAKEVGGDFYDFFFIDDHRLCFLIADVSDKGVPAALYMMVTKTLLKTEGQRLRDPASILASVNNILAEDNENCMFATVFCGVLDLSTGDLHYSNAGHNPPLLITTTNCQYLPVPAGFLLGPMANSRYDTMQLRLMPGDILFLYTDGVTEAKNREDQLYGEARLQATLRMAPREHLDLLLQAIGNDVSYHANGAAQSDDITMMAIRLRDNSQVRRHTVQPDQKDKRKLPNGISKPI
jgi:sigma-B regulation protein RsbU (phosphoserine phosphatase)